MTPRVKQFGQCGCGRSMTGRCEGFHAFSAAEWKVQQTDVINRRLRDILAENACEVTFTKVDGTVRTMRCTLRAADLPLREATESIKTTKYNPDTLSVFDSEKKSWRSFRIENVISVQIL